MVLEASGTAGTKCPHSPLQLIISYYLNYALSTATSSKPRQQPTQYTSVFPRCHNVYPHRLHQRLSDPGRGSRMPSLASSYARTSRSSLSIGAARARAKHIVPLVSKTTSADAPALEYGVRYRRPVA